MKKFTHIEHDIPKLQRITDTDGSRKYQTPDGNAYPSVTTVTGLLNKKAIMEWRKRVGSKVANEISGRAARRGTRIHNLCEDYLSNKQIEIDMFEILCILIIYTRCEMVKRLEFIFELFCYNDELYMQKGEFKFMMNKLCNAIGATIQIKK